MPTKPNRSGEQQNYIPKGNGEVSGEYGDKATGSNVHITISKKESGTVIESKTATQLKEPITKPEEITKQVGESKEKIKSYIAQNSKLTKPVISLISEIVENGEEQCNNALNNALKKHFYSFKSGRSCYMHNAEEIQLSSGDLKSDYRESGETFYHETGHLIDFQDKKSSFENPISCSYVSKTFGRTLKDMVIEEGNNFANNKEIIQETKQKQLDYERQELEKAGLTEDFLKGFAERTKNHQEKYDLTFRDINKKITNLNTDFISDKINYQEYKKAGNELRDEKFKIQDKFLEENKTYVEENKQVREKKYKAMSQAHKNYAKEYSSLSDMYEAATKGRDFGAGGHGASYWRKNSNNQAVEFFAEIYSAKAIKSKQYDNIKKYYPKSVEIFEEILKGLA